MEDAEQIVTEQEAKVGRPFLKWAGGKGRLLPDLLVRVPKDFGRYFEPFLGGGAFFFGLNPATAALSDVNRELVNAYEVVRDNVESLISHLSEHKANRRYFYKVRKLDRRPDFWTFSQVERASRFIYLNKTCFNGLCRVNSEGFFNVPYGMYKNPKILDEENLRACSEVLQGVKIRHASYVDTLTETKRGDFVYLDPPYVPLSATSSFTSYSQDGFAFEDQMALASMCREIHERGVQFMLTNSDTQVVLDLYQGFEIERINSPRSVSADGGKRKPVKDILVRNYR